MPVALPFIALGLSAVGTGIGVVSAIKQGEAASDAAKFNAKVAENDAIAAAQQSALQQTQIARENRLRAGRARAAYGKSGIDISGAGDVLADIGTQGELDRLAAQYTGAVTSNYYRSKAAGERFSAANYRSAGRLSAAGTLFSGIGSAVSIGSRIGSSGKQSAPKGPTYTNQGS